MRVLHVIDSLWVGGTERSLAEMLPPLRDAGVESIVACFRHREDGVEALVRSEGVTVHVLAEPARLRRIGALRRLVRELAPDLVHASLFDASLDTRIACAGVDTRVLNSIPNIPYDPARLRDPNVRAARLRAARWLDTITARLLVDHFHAVSHAVARALTEQMRIPADRITVIPRGRDGARLGRPGARRRRRARDELGIRADVPVLVNVGRHEYQKAQEVLLSALPGLIAEFPGAVLLIAGRPGHATPRLQELIEQLGLAEHARLLGHRDDVPELLAAADLFVFPSRYEGLPGAVIEAMALGLPIVAADIEPVREVVDDGGNAALVPIDRPAALEARCRQILADPSRREKMGRRSRALFEERFELDHSVRAMLRLYQRLCGTAASGAPIPEPERGGHRA